MGGCGRAALLAVFLLLACGAAAAEERRLVLELVVNGHATGRVGEFIEAGGRLMARPQELRELGFTLPPALAGGSEPIPLAGIPGIETRLDLRRGTLAITGPVDVVGAREIDPGRRIRMAPLSPAGWGMVVNYDLLGTFSETDTFGGAFLDTRAFSPYGTLAMRGIGYLDPEPGQSPFVRLDTAYTYAEPDEMRRWHLGDVLSGGLSWTRPVRMGGAQVITDFAMRPDLISYPLPVLSASAAVPSTVDLMINGVRTLSQPIEPGPFQLRSLPVVTGAGEVMMTVTDALGRQNVVAVPFYVSTLLLRPGLASYALEAGAVRRRYGTDDSNYGGWAASGTLRYGLTDWLTLETHAESAGDLLAAGAGGAFRIGTFGILTAALAGSIGDGGLAGDASRPSNGYLVSLGFERRTPRFSIFGSGTIASTGYRDIAAVNGAPVPRRSWRTGLSTHFGRYGSFSLAYVGRRAGDRLTDDDDDLYLGSAGTDVSLVTASYVARLSDRVNLYVTGYADTERSDSYGAGIGISFSWGGRVYSSAGAGVDSGRTSVRTQVQQSALVPGDFGFRLYDSEGSYPHRFAEATYISPYGRVTGGADHTDSSGAAGRVGVTGSLALAGGGVFASNTINDSFAVVSSGDVPNVGVLYENRPIGATDSNGRLLVPYLNSFENNRLALDPADLPPDVEAAQLRTMVRPGDRVGVTVDFGVRTAASALLRLTDAEGRPVPVGARLRLSGGASVPVGYGGEAFVGGLGPRNEGEVEYPDGRRCRVAFDYRPLPGDLPVIGPLPCR